MTRGHLDCMPKVAMHRAFHSGPILEEYFCWNVLRDANIDPQIQTLHILAGGATTLIFMLGGFEPFLGSLWFKKPASVMSSASSCKI